MEHTKKFVLVDPRFVRPSMRDKVLSGLDTEISNILNEDVSDEIKAKSYISALARFRSILAPPKPVKTAPIPQLPSASPIAFKAMIPPKRPHKRVKVESVPTSDPTLWRRTQRTPKEKKFGPQWLSFTESPSKTKKRAVARKTWIDQ